jgi:hypothetical protein
LLGSSPRFSIKHQLQPHLSSLLSGLESGTGTGPGSYIYTINHFDTPLAIATCLSAVLAVSYDSSSFKNQKGFGSFSNSAHTIPEIMPKRKGSNEAEQMRKKVRESSLTPHVTDGLLDQLVDKGMRSRRASIQSERFTDIQLQSKRFSSTVRSEMRSAKSEAC